MTVYDQLNRPLRDLRLSVIDRCNFRCTYCMPKEEIGSDFQWLKKQERLSFDEMIRCVRLFVKLGVVKVRLTGGEPLLRKNLAELIQQIDAIPQIEDIAMTTNGILLSQLASKLKNAGLKRITVSLDALDPAIFQEMNGGFDSLEAVLRGIDTAQQVGFSNIKINTVIRRDFNCSEIIPLLERFRGSGITVRFIEYMDVGNLNHWQRDQVVPSAEIIDRICERWSITPVAKNNPGEVADRYCFTDGSGEIGFISSISQPFCRACNRGRLSADGKLFRCLFATTGTDLKTTMRSGASDEELLALMMKTWTSRKDQYSQQRWGENSKKESKEKIEMFYIGG